MELPVPCYHCHVFSKHGCTLQPVCSEVKRYIKARLEAELVEYNIRKGERIERRMR